MRGRRLTDFLVLGIDVLVRLPLTLFMYVVMFLIAIALYVILTPITYLVLTWSYLCDKLSFTSFRTDILPLMNLFILIMISYQCFHSRPNEIHDNTFIFMESDERLLLFELESIYDQYMYKNPKDLKYIIHNVYNYYNYNDVLFLVVDKNHSFPEISQINNIHIFKQNNISFKISSKYSRSLQDNTNIDIYVIEYDSEYYHPLYSIFLQQLLLHLNLNVSKTQRQTHLNNLLHLLNSPNPL